VTLAATDIDYTVHTAQVKPLCDHVDERADLLGLL
jgi:hypothetical protein